MRTQTTEKTFNKKVKKAAIELMPTAKTIRKIHVAGCGYVYFFKDENNNNVGNVSKSFRSGMLISVN